MSNKEIRIRIAPNEFDTIKLAEALDIPHEGGIDSAHMKYMPNSGELIIANKTKKEVQEALAKSKPDQHLILQEAKKSVLKKIAKQSKDAMEDFLTTLESPAIDADIMSEIVEESADFLARKGQDVSSYPLLEVYAEAYGKEPAIMAKEILSYKSKWIQFAVKLERTRLSLQLQLDKIDTVEGLRLFYKDFKNSFSF